MNKSKKKFNAVEMKRKIQAEIYEEVKNLTPEQELEYYRKSSERGVFGKLFNSAHRKMKNSSIK